jgi:CheY-like chemotaxis protein
VLDAIRSHPGTSATPVIIVSIVAGERQSVARSLGASGFIVKPVSPEALRQAVVKELQ